MADEKKTLTYADLKAQLETWHADSKKNGDILFTAKQTGLLDELDDAFKIPDWKPEYMGEFLPPNMKNDNKYISYNDVLAKSSYFHDFVYDSSTFEKIPAKTVLSITEETTMAVKKTTKAAAQKNIDLQKALLDGFYLAKTTAPANVAEFHALVQSHYPTPAILPELKTLYFYEKLTDEYTALAVRFNPNIGVFEIATKSHYYEIPDAKAGKWDKVKFGPFYPLAVADPKKSYGTFFYYNSHHITGYWMGLYMGDTKKFDALKTDPFINASHDPVPDYVHNIWNMLNPTEKKDEIVTTISGVTIATTDEVEYFEVDSEKEDGTTYKVAINKTTDIHTCECKSYIFSKKKPKSCKHIKEVLDSMDFEDELAQIKSKLANDKILLEQLEKAFDSEVPK